MSSYRGVDRVSIHQKDANDISLQQRLPVVLAVRPSVPENEAFGQLGGIGGRTSGAILSWTTQSQSRMEERVGRASVGTHTMEMSVAITDATPAIHVAVASNFWPVPPVISATG